MKNAVKSILLFSPLFLKLVNIFFCVHNVTEITNLIWKNINSFVIIIKKAGLMISHKSYISQAVLKSTTVFIY